jgi:histidinol-phosphate aminotransferase
MSPLISRRDDLAQLEGYHSPQVPASVRLNTNESPFAPPESWREDLAGALERIEFNRYPDRQASELRGALAEYHGVDPKEIFCANGSNEVLQCLLLAYGGPGRRVLVFQPTYALHRHIALLTGTEVYESPRTPAFTIDEAEALGALSTFEPTVTFLCSPNNPTGRTESPELVAAVVAGAPGLVVVDEAYGQFAHWSALEWRVEPGELDMAGARLGYLIGDPEVVAACEAAALPYHLSSLTQAAGMLALRYKSDMEGRVAVVSEERGRLAAALGALPVETWPSDANFILFRPTEVAAGDVWQALVERSVLVRNCSTWPGLPGCLRVTVGTPRENETFLRALEEILQ